MRFVTRRIKDIPQVQLMTTTPARAMRNPVSSFEATFDVTDSVSVRDRWTEYRDIFIQRPTFGETINTYCLDGGLCLTPNMLVSSLQGQIVRETIQKSASVYRTPEFLTMDDETCRRFINSEIDFEADIRPAVFDGRDYAVLSSAISQNYYHWIVECLPKIACLPKDVPILINAPLTRFHLQTLEYFGAHERIHPIAQPVISSRTYFCDPLARSNVVFSNFIRDFYEPAVASNTHRDRKIYVTRRSAESRRLTSESLLLAGLNSLGYECIDPTDMSFEEQISIFSQSAIVIAPHGAALANIVFCCPGTKVVELNHDLFCAGATSYAALSDLLMTRSVLAVSRWKSQFSGSL